MILPFGSHTPTIAQDAYVAPNATVIGRVAIGAASSVWFQTVIRGDVHWITIGDRCNIQDRCVVHVSTDTWPTILENSVSVGHSVTLHGCTLRTGCLIGMGSIIMDGAVIGRGTLIGAGSLVTPGTHIPDGVLALGQPCRVKRQLNESEREHVAMHATRYVDLAKQYLEQSK